MGAFYEEERHFNKGESFVEGSRVAQEVPKSETFVIGSRKQNKFLRKFKGITKVNRK